MNFDKTINRLGTYCTQWDYTQDRFGKKGLLPFTISDMDIQTSPEIMKIFQKKIAHGIFGYTRWDHSDYKGAIAHWYQKRFQTIIEESWIVYSPNVINALVRFLNLINPNKKAVCLITPCYDGFVKILDSNAFPMNKVHQRQDVIDWEVLEQQLSKSAVFLLCNPNNPNGHLWSEAELKEIVCLCKKHSVFLLSDDIHMDFVYKPNRFTPILKVSKDMDYEHRTIIITSCSKTFNLSGLGGAYAICPNNDLKEQYLRTLKDCDALGSAMVLHIESLITGYTQSELWVDQLCAYLHDNLMIVQNFFQTKNMGMISNVPPSTYFSWIDCSPINLTMAEIQDRLINRGGIAIMDGNRYLEMMPFLRMNIAAPRSKIQEGLARIEKSFSP